MLNYSSNAEILRQLDRVVIGHSQAKKCLISAINKSKIMHQQEVLVDMGFNYEHQLEPSKILLIGGSGTGKTFLIHELQKIVHFPLLCVDASSFTPSGGVDGGTKATGLIKKIQDHAKHLCNSDSRYPSYPGVLNQMVVFVDEFDKVASHWSDGQWNAHVQANFLTLFGENSPFPNITWIFAGAFTDIKKHGKLSKSIGFTKVEEAVEQDKIEDEEIIKYGLIPEIVGRLSHIVELDIFDEDTLKDILVNVLWPTKVKELEFFNYPDIRITTSQVEQIVKTTFKNKLGVRGLKRELNKLFIDAEFYCEEYPQKTDLNIEELIEVSDETEFFEEEFKRLIYKD
jgi:ATP-dependent Clp protease ATP-binding subunit ClpX